MTIIKGQSIVENPWHLHQEDEPLDNNSIVDLSYWLKNRDELKASKKTLGLLVNGDASINALKEDLNDFVIIAINIPVFTDGRAYSLCKLIRHQYNFVGEIRAVGDILPDQARYLTRVGFDALELENDEFARLAIDKLNDYSVFYQAS